MKKKIIMLAIILMSSLSLLLIMFYIKTKDIKYINSSEINKYGITMLLETEEGQTNITEVPNEGYYKIEYTCENNSAVINWSNISHNIKIKVTDSPVKCTLSFTEVTEDINMVAMTVNNVESSTVPTNGWYDMTYSCVDENDNTLSGAALPIITWDNYTHKLTTSNISSKIFCTVEFTTITVLNFSYTGDVQKISLPTGKYKIELWGASASILAGSGAYTKGDITLTSSTDLMIYVGAFTQAIGNTTLFNAGYGTDGGWPGGGATDVRILDLGNWNNWASLNSRIMVAAGGGSAGYNYCTGSLCDAGGLYGYLGISGTTPATQITQGTSTNFTHFSLSGFGEANGGCAGGNGYYGGAGNGCASGTGGGSSFISGHTGCVSISYPDGTINNSSLPRLTVTDSNGALCSSTSSTGYNANGYNTDHTCSLHPSGLVFSNTLMIDGYGKKWVVNSGTLSITNQAMPNPAGGYYGTNEGRTGDGYARITVCPNGTCP